VEGSAEHICADICADDFELRNRQIYEPKASGDGLELHREWLARSA
jgi:hypothetical protein